MRYFEQDGGNLVWRSKNETLVLTPGARTACAFAAP